MTYKTVSLNEKAYQLLKRSKKEHESFSDAIIRVMRKPDLSKFLAMAGSLKGEIDQDELDSFIEEAKDAWK